MIQIAADIQIPFGAFLKIFVYTQPNNSLESIIE